MLHIRSFRICFCFKRIILHHKFETSFYVSNSKNDDIIQLQSFIYYFKIQLQVKFQVMLPIHNDHNPNSKCQSTIQNCNFRLQFQFASSDGNVKGSTQVVMPYFLQADLAEGGDLWKQSDFRQGVQVRSLPTEAGALHETLKG